MQVDDDIEVQMATLLFRLSFNIQHLYYLGLWPIVLYHLACLCELLAYIST